MLRTLALSVAFALAATSASALPENVPPPRREIPPPNGPGAQATANAVEDMVHYMDQFNSINARLADVMQTLPELPHPDAKDDSATRTFVAAARAWSANTLQLTQTLRADLASIGPPPPNSPDIIIQASARLRADFPGDLDVTDDFARRYAGMADAIERGDPEAAGQLQIAAIEAVGITLRRSRDTLVAQAALIPDARPEAHLLRSYAFSYEGGVTQMEYARGIIAGQTVNFGALAQALQTSAANMRREITTGRACIITFRNEISQPGAISPADRLIAPRIFAALGTLTASFDREDRIAAELEAMATLLASGRGAEAIADEWDAHLGTFGTLDYERVADGQRRAAILRGE